MLESGCPCAHRPVMFETHSTLAKGGLHTSVYVYFGSPVVLPVIEKTRPSPAPRAITPHSTDNARRRPSTFSNTASIVHDMEDFHSHDYQIECFRIFLGFGIKHIRSHSNSRHAWFWGIVPSVGKYIKEVFIQQIKY